MDVKKCDRCGTYYDMDPLLTNGSIKISICLKHGITPYWKEKDLCPECENELHNWFFNCDKKEQVNA